MSQNRTVAPLNLHVHTNYSLDGRFSPAQQVRFLDETYRSIAKKRTPKPIIAFTDHENSKAQPEAAKLAKKYGLTVFRGSEYSVNCKDDTGYDHHMHMTVLFPTDDRRESERLAERLEDTNRRIEGYRLSLAKETLDALADQGWSTKYIRNHEIIDGHTITKRRIAELLYEDSDNLARIHKMRIKSSDELRKHIVMPNSALTRHLLTAQELIKLVHDFGGHVIVAHPYLPHRPDPYRALISLMTDRDRELRVDGVEALYPSVFNGGNSKASRDLVSLLSANKTVPVVGSDTHNTKNYATEQFIIRKLFESQDPVVKVISRQAQAGKGLAVTLNQKLKGRN